VVLLIMRLKEDGVPPSNWPLSLCTGTMVGGRDDPFVLTAKHCIDSAALVSLTLVGCGVASAYALTHLGRDVDDFLIHLHGSDHSNYPSVAYLFPSASPATSSAMFAETKLDVALLPVKSAPRCGIEASQYAPIGGPSLASSELLALVGYGYNDDSVGFLQYLTNHSIASLSRTANDWVSSETRRVYAAGPEIHTNVDATGIRKGDSGGPAFDTAGRVVGVGSYITSSSPKRGAHVNVADAEVSAWVRSVLALPREAHVPDPSMQRVVSGAEPVPVPVPFDLFASAAARRTARVPATLATLLAGLALAS
jgi:hypothetical protein